LSSDVNGASPKKASPFLFPVEVAQQKFEKRRSKMKLTASEIKAVVSGSLNTAEVAYRLCQAVGLKDSDDTELYFAAYELRLAAENIVRLSDRVAKVGRETSEKLSRTPIWRDDSMNLLGPFYCGVNSLGELQGTASEFDIFCALYSRAHDRLCGLIRARFHEEKKAERAQRRASYSGVEYAVLSYFESTNSKCVTVNRLATDLLSTKERIVESVKKLAAEPDPFVNIILNSKNEVREVAYIAQF